MPAYSPACPSPATSAFDFGDTTHQYKTHNAEPREVQYPWHPWFGRTVWVYRIVVRGTRSGAHCGLDRVQCARSLEVPLWMLEAASCSTLRLAENPIVDCTALQRLKMLLHGGVLEDRHSSLGGADADPQGSTPRSTSCDRGSASECAKHAQSKGQEVPANSSNLPVDYCPSQTAFWHHDRRSIDKRRTH